VDRCAYFQWFPRSRQTEAESARLALYNLQLVVVRVIVQLGQYERASLGKGLTELRSDGSLMRLGKTAALVTRRLSIFAHTSMTSQLFPPHKFLNNQAVRCPSGSHREDCHLARHLHKEAKRQVCLRRDGPALGCGSRGGCSRPSRFQLLAEFNSV
jgi:hypothetical protein